jgi:hypothetical protein
MRARIEIQPRFIQYPMKTDVKVLLHSISNLTN